MYRVAHESDVVRLLVLHRFGGTYVDTDMLFLRPLDDAVTARSGMGLETVAGANHEFHVPSSRRINNAILHAPAPRDPFVACMIGELGARYDPGVWACIGPDLVGECHDRLAAKAPLDAPALFPREWFYPLDWRFTWYVNLSNRSRWRLDSFWLPGERAATYGLHLYNSHSSAQLENHRKGGGYHNTGGPQAGSYLEEVLARVPLPPQCRAIELNTGPTLGPPRDGEEAF
jgi:mannosyltransferase OCH1-like enzyme